MSETRRVSKFPYTLLDQLPPTPPDQGPKPAISTDDAPPKSNKTVSFSGSLNSSRKPSGVTKIQKPPKDVKRRNENPWEAYRFVHEIVRTYDTETRARKIVSGQMFCFRTFRVGKKFEVIEQQFRLLDHHNVLPAQEFFRNGDEGFIRSPVMDVSFERVVTCSEYPSSGTLASMMGQVCEVGSVSTILECTNRPKVMDGLVYLVSNGIICNSLSCSKILANKDGCIKIVAFSDAEMQKDIRASTKLLIRQLAVIMVLLMQKHENEPGEVGIHDSARWPPKDEACKFLHDLQKDTDFHRMHHHLFINLKRRDGGGFKDLVEKTLDTTVETHVRLRKGQDFQSV